MVGVNLKNLKSIPVEFMLGWVLAGLLFFLLLVRANIVPFAHDEAASFFFFIQTGEFIPGVHYFDANNHILNSFLSWISFSIFGSSELALRLPNILAFPVYVYFIAKLASRIHHRPIRISFVLAMLLAPGLFEFFALCRGYGISMALLTGSTWYLIRHIETGRTQYFILTFVSVTAATLANLTLVVPFSGIIAYSLIFILRKKRSEGRIRMLLTWIILGIVPLLAYSFLLFKMHTAGMLYYGTGNQRPGESLLSISEMLSGSASTPVLYFFALLLILGLLSVIALVASGSHRKVHLPGVLFAWLFVSGLAIVIILGLAFGINYPEDRTGVYFFPLLLGCFVFSADYLSSERKWIRRLPLVLIIFPVFFLFNERADSSILWRKITPPESFYTVIEEEYEATGILPTLSGHSLNLLCYDYVNMRRGGLQNQVQVADYPSNISDFIIGYDHEVRLLRPVYKPVLSDPLSSLILWKRDPFLVDSLLHQELFDITCRGIRDSIRLYQGVIELHPDTPPELVFQFNLRSDESPFRGWLVAEIHDGKGQQECHEIIVLDWKKYKWIDGRSKYSMYLPVTIEDKGYLKIYLLNRDHQSFRLSGSVQVKFLVSPGGQLIH